MCGLLSAYGHVVKLFIYLSHEPYLIILFHLFSDAGDGRNAAAGKENGINPAADKGVGSTLPTSHGIKNKETVSVAR